MPDSFNCRHVPALAAGAGMFASAHSSWPTRPVPVLAPSAPTGTTDLLARWLATELQRAVGQPFIIENRSGAGGNLGTAEVARSSDGHCVLRGSVGSGMPSSEFAALIASETAKWARVVKASGARVD